MVLSPILAPVGGSLNWTSLASCLLCGAGGPAGPKQVGRQMVAYHNVSFPCRQLASYSDASPALRLRDALLTESMF